MFYATMKHNYFDRYGNRLFIVGEPVRVFYRVSGNFLVCKLDENNTTERVMTKDQIIED